jgi:hypothetical protein
VGAVRALSNGQAATSLVVAVASHQFGCVGWAGLCTIENIGIA